MMDDEDRITRLTRIAESRRVAQEADNLGMSPGRRGNIIQGYRDTPPKTRLERIEDAKQDALEAAAPSNTTDPGDYAHMFQDRPAERLLDDIERRRISGEELDERPAERLARGIKL